MKRIDLINQNFKLNQFLLWAAGFIGATLIGWVSTSRGSDILGLMVIIVSLLLLFAIVSNLKDHSLGYILFLAFFFRVSIALLGAFVIKLPDSDADALMFENLGNDIAKAWSLGTAPPDTPGAYIYSKLIGAIYLVTGRIPLLAQFLNVILGVLIVYFCYRLVLELFGSKQSSYKAAFIAAVFPTLNLYSAVTLRENLVTLFLAASICYFLKWVKSGSILYIGTFFTLLLCASRFHGAVVLIGAVYALYLCFYSPKNKKWRLFSKQMVISLTAVVVLGGLFRSKLLNKLPSDISLWFSPDYLRERMGDLAVGRGAYLTDLVPHSILDLVIQTPVRIIYFMFSPFPWMLSGVGDLIGFMDAALYIILLYFAIKGLKYIGSKSKEAAWAVVLIFVLGMTMFAWGTANYGTAIRHRQKFAPLVIAVSAIGIGKRKEKGLELKNDLVME